MDDKKKSPHTSAQRQVSKSLKFDKTSVKKTGSSSSMKRKAFESIPQINVKKSRTPKSENLISKRQSIKSECVAENRQKKEDKTAGFKTKTQTTLSKSNKNHSDFIKEKDLKKEEEEEGEGEGEEEEEVVEDQTENILTGFPSDSDGGEKIAENGTDSKQSKHSHKDKLGDLKNRTQAEFPKNASDKPGVVYVGRIPHGFYEHEMKDYFSQFGPIRQIRLSRNKKTGASKHHAWIKFESEVVAEIVAKSMDNYLMFGHLLKVKLVSDDKVPEDLFKGANKRFKKVPWNKMEGRKLKQPLPREAWQRRIIKEQKRRLDKSVKLKEIGYVFESPKITSVDQISTDPISISGKDHTCVNEASSQEPQNGSVLK